jgi:hypothetical protein
MLREAVGRRAVYSQTEIALLPANTCQVPGRAVLVERDPSSSLHYATSVVFSSMRGSPEGVQVHLAYFRTSDECAFHVVAVYKRVIRIATNLQLNHYY